MTEPTALELAHYMEDTERWNVAGVQMQNCAEMLRRQHEAISVLREALALIGETDAVDAALDPQRAVRVAKQALKDTGELK